MSTMEMLLIASNIITILGLCALYDMNQNLVKLTRDTLEAWEDAENKWKAMNETESME
jgi:hypothetical protein